MYGQEAAALPVSGAGEGVAVQQWAEAALWRAAVFAGRLAFLLRAGAGAEREGDALAAPVGLGG